MAMTRRPVPTSSRLGLPTGDYSVELYFDGEFAASFSGVQVGDLPPAIVNSDTGGEFRLNPPASQAGELDAALPSRLFRFDVPAGARILRVVLTTTQGVASPHLRAGAPPWRRSPCGRRQPLRRWSRSMLQTLHAQVPARGGSGATGSLHRAGGVRVARGVVQGEAGQAGRSGRGAGGEEVPQGAGAGDGSAAGEAVADVRRRGALDGCLAL